MATEKILVHKSVTQKFLAALKPAVNKMYGEKQTLVLPAGPDKVRSLVSAATDAGASTELNGTDSYGKQEHPNMIITNVTESMDLYHTESFGPVVAVFEIEDDEEAVRRANDSEYGLSAAVWTKDLGRALKIAKGIESGAVHINGPTVHDEAGLPHGGRKASGYGRFGADWGLGEWVTSKTVTFRV
jgi:acyl-CoA reductase-like NAD-dependent aldehyde dehydrogenase